MPAAAPRERASARPRPPIIAALDEDGLVAAIDRCTDRLGPAADALAEVDPKDVAALVRNMAAAAGFVGGLEKRVDGWSEKARRWFWPVALSIPSVLVSIGAITPQAAAFLRALLGGAQ